MYFHKAMVFVVHTLVYLFEVYDEPWFVQVRLFQGKNWAVVQARRVFSDRS